jgi:hypothetical protein
MAGLAEVHHPELFRGMIGRHGEDPIGIIGDQAKEDDFVNQERVEKAPAGPGTLADATVSEREGDSSGFLQAREIYRPFLQS